MDREYRFKSTFTAVATVIAPSDEDRHIAKASLTPLQHLLPPGINPDADPDLLYFAANGAVANLGNKNGDAVSGAVALAIHATCRNKYVNVDHDRDKVVGVILYPGLSRYGTNEPLAEDVAATLQEPFNMSFAGIVWKTIAPMVSKYIVKSEGGTSRDVLSFSWEICFDQYAIAIGSSNLLEAQMVKAEDPQFAIYDKMLRSNGGAGEDPSGKPVFRVISDDAILLGYSIVPNPAADVKGILPLVTPAPAPVEPDILAEIPESQRSIFAAAPEAGLGYHLCDITMNNGVIQERVPVLRGRYMPHTIDPAAIATITLSEKSAEKNITDVNTRVTPHTHDGINASQSTNHLPAGQPESHARGRVDSGSDESRINGTTITMKIEKLEQLTSDWDAIRKLESAAAVVDFVKVIQDGSTAYVQQLQAKEDLLKNAEAAKAESEKKVKEVEASLAELQKELTQIRASQESAEAQQKFQERMASFDEEFELDAEDRKIITTDIKDLDDAAFAAYMEKSKKLMAGKKKKAKSECDDEEKKKMHDKEMKDKEMKAAVASVTEDPNQPKLPNGTQVDVTVLDQMKAAFGASFKINGKSAAEIGKKKEAK